MFFEGATGKVSKVEPYYIDIKVSFMAAVLSSVYRKATSSRFREIEHQVRHTLAP